MFLDFIQSCFSGKREGVKNFKLISFGDEAEQDEQEVEKFPKEPQGNDELKKPTSNTEASSSKKDKSRSSSSKREQAGGDKETKEKAPERSRSVSMKPKKDSEKKQIAKPADSGSDSDYESTMEKAKREELEKKKKEIQDQIKDLTKQYQKDRKEKAKPVETEMKPKAQHDDEAIQRYLDEKEKYKEKKLNMKGKSREDFTLSLLSKFKSKLHSALEETPAAEEEEIVDSDEDKNWLAHKLDFSESAQAVLAKDASKKEDDWYDIYDPRNPINKRKRAEKSDSRGGHASKRK